MLGFNNPLPSSMASECSKAAKILESFINPKDTARDAAIPSKVLTEAKGFVVFSVFTLGALASIKFGSGLIVARLPDGSWSAPSAIATGGLGAGTHLGLELTDFLLVLNTDKAVDTFSRAGALTVGSDCSMALGPFGKCSSRDQAGLYTYSKARGLYLGHTFEGGVLLERSDANSKMYGKRVKAKQVLKGEIPAPPESKRLIDFLNANAPLAPTPSTSTTNVTSVGKPPTPPPRPMASPHLGNPHSSNSIGHPPYSPGASPYSPDSYQHQPHPPQTYSPQPYQHQTHPPQTYSPQPYQHPSEPPPPYSPQPYPGYSHSPNSHSPHPHSPNPHSPYSHPSQSYQPPPNTAELHSHSAPPPPIAELDSTSIPAICELPADNTPHNPSGQQPNYNPPASQPSPTGGYFSGGAQSPTHAANGHPQDGHASGVLAASQDTAFSPTATPAPLIIRKQSDNNVPSNLAPGRSASSSSNGNSQANAHATRRDELFLS
ncbi:DUF500-domain-containing protein [Aspergillus campestris IBT 28561]|uniref:DUF500-domain-containing protein n=1 Tax=Aspergillus campestris (strain IBT 28561) TaxID=1392248 RepID=A0A2I1CWM9_ASPC2|nr:DUF500-domain-containing protein [Aspergillus campestris IBT 28561]PKY02020.1 DUF500-domain-containing protein [Aspergillus campestris IBT 28561]